LSEKCRNKHRSNHFWWYPLWRPWL
jgi:hypothetical protein